MDPQTEKTKIGNIQPNQKHLNLEFEIAEILEQDNNGLKCRIVDESGIINAFFDKYQEKMQPNIVYQMTNLKSKVVSNHLQIQMSKNTVVSKEPAIIGYKDKSNDLSKKFYVLKTQEKDTEKSSNREVLIEQEKKPESLIPFSREEARQQIRLKREFEQNTKRTKKPNLENFKDSKQSANSKFYKEKEDEKDKNSMKYKSKKHEEVKYQNKDKKYEKNQHQFKEGKNEADNGQTKIKKSSQAYVEKTENKNQSKKRKQKEQNLNEGQKNNEFITLIQALDKLESQVNVKVWVSTDKRNIRESDYQCLISDKSGSLWAKFSKGLKIQEGHWFEISNLLPKKVNNSIILQETKLSEAKVSAEKGFFDLKILQK